MIETCGIIGYGKLGSALAELLASQGRLSWICVHKKSQIPLAEKCGVPVFDSLNAIEKTDCILITVQDSVLENVVRQILEIYSNGNRLWIMHCSGAFGQELFSSAKSMNYNTACIHPFQTILNKQSLHDIPWGVECEKNDEEVLSDFVSSLHGNPVFLSEETKTHKAAYHATAVIAANFMTVLVELSSHAARNAKIDPAVFLPMIQMTALRNAHDAISDGKSALDMLTGPLLRGDIETIQSHIQSFPKNSVLEKFYRHMSLATLEILLQSQKIEKAQYESMIQQIEKCP